MQRRILWRASLSMVMIVSIVLVGAVTFIQPTTPAKAVANEVALKPPMGWNPYNYWYLNQNGPCCNYNEQFVKANADALVSSGMLAAGYQYVNLDAGWWSSSVRDGNGILQADPTHFPSGIQALADYVHSKCVTSGGQQICAKFGIYLSPDISRFQEQKDANTLAGWGVDYLKYDYFFSSAPDAGNSEQQYAAMGTALLNNSYGRPIAYSVNAADVPWVNNPHLSAWRPHVSHVWRTTADIFNGNNDFDSVREIINHSNQSSDAAAAFAGPGRWNDPDMLEVGNGMNETEDKSHFSMWAMFAAPLLAGNNLSTMSETTRQILTNTEVIAIDQDTGGYQATKVSDNGAGLQVWSRPLQDGSVAVALLNLSDASANISTSWGAVGLLAGNVWVRDLWEHADKGWHSSGYTANNIPAHGVVMLRAWPNGYEAESGTLSGGAVARSCGSCSNGSKVGDIGPNGGSFTINNVNAPNAGTYTLTIAYGNADASRDARISVNGQAATTYSFPGTGGWDSIGTYQVKVQLQAGNNSITVSNPTGWAPDFDRIVVRKNTYARSYEAEMDSNFGGGATLSGCGSCSHGQKIGFLGPVGSFVTIKGIHVPYNGTYPLTIYYTNGDSSRTTEISINGGGTFTVTLPGTGGWENVGSYTVPVRLNAGGNTITFSNSSSWSSDIDRITV